MGPAPDVEATPLDRPDAAVSATPPVRRLATAAEQARPTIAVIGIGFVTLFVCLLAFGRIAEDWSTDRRRSRSMAS